MLFSSLTFLFVFLPVTIGLYFLVKDKYKNYVLLIMSLIFYAWGEPKYIVLMVLSIVVNYFLALIISRSKSGVKRFTLWVAVILNIGTLFAFKYLDFAINNINLAFNFNLNTLGLALPIGISFYTFQILSYVIDVYRGKTKVQKNIFTLGTYIALFPQLIAGPIVRYVDVRRQLKRRKHSVEKVCDGLRRFIVGFLKKVLIANSVAVVADKVFDNPSMAGLNLLIVIVALIAYTLQIYFDFSGYSDMAIGLGKVFGFDFDENFNYPYSAVSVTDFWRRWHISLTTWFRDYLYIPLGGNRCSKIKWIRNFFIVWLLTGLWHGASWNFVLWGVFYAIVLLVEKTLTGKYIAKMPKVLAWIYTFAIVNFGWLLFRVNSLSDLKCIGEGFMNFDGTAEFISNNYATMPYLGFIIVGLVCMFPLGKKIKKKMMGKRWGGLVFDATLVLLFVLAISFLISSSYNPFIYFRF